MDVMRSNRRVVPCGPRSARTLAEKPRVTENTPPKELSARGSCDSRTPGRRSLLTRFVERPPLAEVSVQHAREARRFDSCESDKALAARLAKAARIGDLAEVQDCLLKGAPDRDEHGWAALHYGAAAGHVEVCATLLAAGCDVNATLPDRSTPLMLAVEEAHLLVAQLLLESGALIGCRDDEGFTAFDRCDEDIRDGFAKRVWSPC